MLSAKKIFSVPSSSQPRRKKWSVPSNRRGMDATTSSTKTAATSVKRIKYSKEAFNVIVQFVTAGRKYKAPDGKESNNRKCVFMFGNLEKTPITESASGYLTRGDDPNTLLLHPKYLEASEKLWKDLEEERPLHPDDYITLRTNECYYISVPDTLAASCSVGDFVLLFDVYFGVRVGRDSLKNVLRLDSITEAQRAWKGKKATRKDVHTGANIEYEVKPINPRFFFSARFGTKLPNVSLPSLLKVYQEHNFLTHHIACPETQISIAPAAGYHEDNEVFRMDKVWFEPKDVARIYYDASNDGMADAEAFIAPDGSAHIFEVMAYPDSRISDNDIKYDMEKFKCVRSRSQLDQFNKAWCFMLRISQRIFTKSDDPDAFPETGGYDIDNPTETSYVSAKINLYKETIERDFGILSDTEWIQFITCYSPFFRGIFQCIVHIAKTGERMDRLRAFSSADQGINGDSRPFDYSIDYACNAILFSLQDFIKRIGIPIEKETACQILDSVQELRDITPDEEDMMGHVSSVNELVTKKKHAVACLNQLKSMETAKKWLRQPSVQTYAVLMPDPSTLGAELFEMIESIQDQGQGTTLLRALEFNEDIDKEVHGPLEEMRRSLHLSGYARKAMSPLIFALGTIDEEYYAKEAETISKFLGIAEDKISQVKEWLGDGVVAVDEQNENILAETPPPVEKEVDPRDDDELYGLMSQNALLQQQELLDEDERHVEFKIPEQMDESEVSPHQSSKGKRASVASKRKHSSSSSKPKARTSTRKPSSKKPRARRAV